MFINDIEDILCATDVHMKLFADDVKLYIAPFPTCAVFKLSATIL